VFTPIHPVQCRRQCRFCVHCCGLVALWAPEIPGTRIQGVSGTCLCIVCLVLSWSLYPPRPPFNTFLLRPFSRVPCKVSSTEKSATENEMQILGKLKIILSCCSLSLHTTGGGVGWVVW